MLPRSFEDFMRMLYEQFRGGSAFGLLTQTQRPASTPPPPYGISMQSPFLRGFPGVTPLPQVRDGARPTPKPASPVQRAPIGSPGVTPLPQVRDGGTRRPFNPAGPVQSAPVGFPDFMPLPQVRDGGTRRPFNPTQNKAGGEFRSGTIWG